MKTRITFATATAIGLALAGQAYAAGSNTVYLTQTGNNQDALITQSGGSGNRVGSGGNPFIQENGAGGFGHNKLVVNQNSATGSELANIGAFMGGGGGNVLTGYQSGNLNSAEIDQGGNNSSVDLQQTGQNNGPIGSTPGVPWWNGSFGNLIVQDQTANGSAISLHQANASNASNGNVFNIGQGGSGNAINATQNGYNKLWIRQGTTAPDLWGWTYGNFFSPSYTSYSLGALANSSITVNQTVGGDSQRNYAALGQGSGSADSIVVNQTGGSNSVDANQVGTGNVFNSSQISADGNANWNFVGGEAGWPDVSVNPMTGVAGDYRPVLQLGNGNQYYSTQNGQSLMAFGDQIGNYNFLSNTQSGYLNKLFTKQLGDYNTIFSVQSGDQNTTTVTQSLNGNYSNTTQTGTLNVATISQ